MCWSVHRTSYGFILWTNWIGFWWRSWGWVNLEKVIAMVDLVHVWEEVLSFYIRWLFLVKILSNSFSLQFYVLCLCKKKKKKILRCFLRNTWLLFIKISLKKNPPPCVCVRGYFPTFFFVFLSPLLLCFVLKSLPLFLLAKIFLHEHQQNKIAAARGVFTKEKQRRKCTIEKKVWISPVFFSLFLNLFFFSLFKEFFQVIFFRKFFFRS